MRWRDTLVPLAAAVLVACRVGDDPAPKYEVVVSAAASLTDAFAALETAFESAHLELDVVLNLGGSSLLGQQIIEGAPVDVFASANITNMDQVVKAGEAANSQIFAANRLEIAVPIGNPAGITGLADFANSGLLIGLCIEEAPCGDFARRVLANAGVIPSLDTSEPDVRALLTKIEAGELDAGITFVTDVLSAQGAVEGIEIPDQLNVRAEYPIAVLTRAPHPEGAASFVEFVLSAEGRSILTSFGFLPP